MATHRAATADASRAESLPNTNRTATRDPRGVRQAPRSAGSSNSTTSRIRARLRNEFLAASRRPFRVGRAQPRHRPLDDSHRARSTSTPTSRRSSRTVRRSLNATRGERSANLASDRDASASYEAGETIFDEGEIWPYLAFVRSGKVVYTLLSPDGKTHSIGERAHHDTLNETGDVRRRRRDDARRSADDVAR